MSETTSRIEPLEDKQTEFPVVDSLEVFRGKVFSMLTERVRYGDGVAMRDFVKHPGAVAIVPLREGSASASGEPEVLLINQYRHPVGATLWEIPAGLLDIAGEQEYSKKYCDVAKIGELRH